VIEPYAAIVAVGLGLQAGNYAAWAAAEHGFRLYALIGVVAAVAVGGLGYAIARRGMTRP
jgi:hypothetical protein